jgi:hypothetical protein
VLEATGLPGACLELELDVGRNRGDIEASLRAAAALGVRITAERFRSGRKPAHAPPPAHGSMKVDPAPFAMCRRTPTKHRGDGCWLAQPSLRQVVGVESLQQLALRGWGAAKCRAF